MRGAVLSSLLFRPNKALTCGFTDFGQVGATSLRDILNVGERKKST
jgi:hypothetical protein